MLLMRDVQLHSVLEKTARKVRRKLNIDVSDAFYWISTTRTVIETVSAPRFSPSVGVGD